MARERELHLLLLGNPRMVTSTTTGAFRTKSSERPGGIFTSRKTFTSLSPAWTKLGLHGRDDSDPEHPKIVLAFLDRDAAGVSTVPLWDAVSSTPTSSRGARAG